MKDSLNSARRAFYGGGGGVTGGGTKLSSVGDGWVEKRETLISKFFENDFLLFFLAKFHDSIPK